MLGCRVFKYAALLHKIKWFPKRTQQCALPPACMRVLSALCPHQQRDFLPNSGGCKMRSYCHFNLHFHQDKLSSHMDSRNQDENPKRCVRNILSNWVSFTRQAPFHNGGQITGKGTIIHFGGLRKYQRAYATVCGAG